MTKRIYYNIIKYLFVNKVFFSNIPQSYLNGGISSLFFSSSTPSVYFIQVPLSIVSKVARELFISRAFSLGSGRMSSFFTPKSYMNKVCQRFQLEILRFTRIFVTGLFCSHVQGLRKLRSVCLLLLVCLNIQWKTNNLNNM